MVFITVKSVGGSIWSFRKDRIEMVLDRKHFKQEELKTIPELASRDSCAIIKLIGNNAEFYCDDSYESIMAQITEADE